MTTLRSAPIEAEAAATGSILHAAANIGRFLALIGVLVLLLVMRTEASILVNVLMTAGAVFGLYVAFGRSAGMRMLVVYLIGFGLFDQLRAFGDETGIPASFAYVIGLEKTMFGSVPSVWLQAHFYTPGHTNLLDLSMSAVYVSYFGVVHVVALLIWLRNRRQFPLYAGAVLLTFHLGLLISFVLPTAPPWLAGQNGHIPAVHRVFQELVSQARPQTYEQGAVIAGINDVAAMPSLHMAITVIVAIMAWRFNRLLGAAGALYAAAMAFSLVYLGEHYVTDEIAGAVLAGGCWLMATRLWRDAGSEDGSRAEAVAEAERLVADRTAA